MIERYTLPEMGALWSEANRFARWLEVEILACEAHAERGAIPVEAVRVIREKAMVLPERVKELERVTRHDVAAFVQAAAESVGEEGRYIHYGLTSYDVVDTALSSLMKDAALIIKRDLEGLLDAIREKAIRHRDTLMVGRTHGVHAEPITFGFKMALWYAETKRNIDRISRVARVIGVGRLSGAVGTFAHLDPGVEGYVCRRMGLEPAPVSTQVIQRDRHAEYLCNLALVAASIEQFALEIRGLARTEVGEVEEAFGKGQKGSSAMPHKKNPVVSEQMTGLARLVRSNAQAALENVALWHERDISHSSVERVIIPDSTILVDYMVQTFRDLLRGLVVRPDRMMGNLESTGGLVYSQRVMLALVSSGLSREEAYGIVQALAMEAWEKKQNFKEMVLGHDRVLEVLGREGAAACFDPMPYVRHMGEIYSRVGIDEHGGDESAEG